jgi:hypothetical protein
MPIEAIQAFTNLKIRSEFGFRGLMYTSPSELSNFPQLKINKYLRIDKLIRLLIHYPELIRFSDSSSRNPEMHTSKIFPNKTSSLTTSPKDFKFDGKLEPVFDVEYTQELPLKYILSLVDEKTINTFFEKRDSSMQKGYELHYRILEPQLALGSLFAFQNKMAHLVRWSRRITQTSHSAAQKFAERDARPND